jgi:uncharacterized protein
MSHPPPDPGSQLCLTCGLCCRGVLHEKAILSEEEIPQARAVGLRVETGGDQGPFFRLPCPAHRDGRCSVYSARPRVCSEYRCRILKRYADGEMSLGESLHIVEKARQMALELARRMGSEPGDSFWQDLRALREAEADGSATVPPDLLLEAAALLAFCRNHFEVRAHPLRIVPG